METWKDIKGYEGLYQISSLGIVRSLAPQKKDSRNRPSKKKMIILKDSLNLNGYPYLILYKDKIAKHHQIHILVAKHFCENENNYPWVDHINAIRSDAFYKNLRWCTPKMNVEYTEQAGRSNKAHGKTHTSSKLDEESVIEIKRLYDLGGHTHRTLAELYGVDHSNITRALNSKNWKHVKE